MVGKHDTEETCSAFSTEVKEMLRETAVQALGKFFEKSTELGLTPNQGN